MRRYLCIASIAMVTTLTPALAEGGFESTTTSANSSTQSASVSGSTSCLPGEIRNMLTTIARRFGPVTIISAHRSNAVIAGTRRPSLHRYCRAVDFRVSEKWAAWRWINASWSGGASVYAGNGKNHIHIDNGPRRRWSN